MEEAELQKVWVYGKAAHGTLNAKTHLSSTKGRSDKVNTICNKENANLIFMLMVFPYTYWQIANGLLTQTIKLIAESLGWYNFMGNNLILFIKHLFKNTVISYSYSYFTIDNINYINTHTSVNSHA